MSTKAKVEVIPLTDFLEGWTPQPKLKRIEKPTSIVYFWTYYTCRCGNQTSSPTHSEKPLVKHEVRILKKGKYIDGAAVYYPYFSHDSCNTLPREIIATHIKLEVCDKCLDAPTDPEYFYQRTPLPEMSAEQVMVDQLLFENALEATTGNLEILDEYIQDKGDISVWADKETN